MILQSLYEYYNEIIKCSDSNMPKEGFSREKISFVLEIDKEGNLKNIVDIRQDNNFVMMNVPAANGRTSGVLPNTLWDKTSYVLGVKKSTKKEKKGEFIYELNNKHFESFKLHHQALYEKYKLPELNSLCCFLENWNPDDITKYTHELDFLDSNVVFRMEGKKDNLHEDTIFLPLITDQLAVLLKTSSDKFSCMIDGEENKIALTHPKIKGVRNAQQAGGSLISFNATAFESYNKTQNENGPVSQKAAAAYVNALNYLLDWDNKRNVLIGDTNYLFWSKKPNEVEELFYNLFSYQKTEQNEVTIEDKRTNKQVESVLKAIAKGESVSKSLEFIGEENRNISYYILGLSANNARIVQRYWQVSTLSDLAKHIDQFYQDFAIERQFENQAINPRPQVILFETALNREAKNISPTFPDALMKTILSGYRFPESIYVNLLERIRVERSQRDSKKTIDVLNYVRAGTIKAYLSRNYSNKIGEISMSLDVERKDIAYLLGRLFSIIEKAQKDALGDQINATVKDKFLGTACTNPNLVFPQLLRNVQNHIKKAEYGYRSEKAIGELMESITDFPKTLSLQDQGLFFIGYYHQNNANYKKSEKTTETN